MRSNDSLAASENVARSQNNRVTLHDSDPRNDTDVGDDDDDDDVFVQTDGLENLNSWHLCSLFINVIKYAMHSTELELVRAQNC